MSYVYGFSVKIKFCVSWSLVGVYVCIAWKGHSWNALLCVERHVKSLVTCSWLIALSSAVCLQLMALVQQGSFLPQPGCYEEIYAIMKSCCDVEPYNRPVPQVIIRNIRGFVRQGVPSRLSFIKQDSRVCRKIK